ncbi:MAG: AMP-binding protein, partial [Pseudomonadota bacterium]
MYPGHWATLKPDITAVCNTNDGTALTWTELDKASNQVAQLLASCGLGKGDHVALLMENHLNFFVIAWGVLRSGMYLTCINRYLTPEEIAYIIQDSGSQALFTSDALESPAPLLSLTTELAGCQHRFCHHRSDHHLPGYQDYTQAVAAHAPLPLAEQPMGDTMLYSSGTTGRPKGIKRPLSGKSITEGIPGVERANPYGINEHSRYLSPAPLYHAAPFGFCMRTLSLGGTVYMMERFDPQAALANIENHAISHSQWVPTMFVR